MRAFVTGFQSLTPAYLLAQDASFAWIVEAHARATSTRARHDGSPFDEAAYRAQLARRLARFGCRPDKIASRAVAFEDCAHDRWDAMRVYSVDRSPRGEGMLARTRAYAELAEGAVARLFAEDERPPADLLHVTCTGYVSPSAAQAVVSRRGWGEATRVTHAYHMGCYAALPALRLASGLALAADPLRPHTAQGSPSPRRADVVHTELCSLHFDPLDDSPEQLVVQTLFGDGFVRYGVCDETSLARSPREPAFEILALEEAIVPESGDSMAWITSEWGMRMTLARDVPERLGEVVRPFVARLLRKAGLPGSTMERARFAVHPGGPRILDRVRDVLGIAEEQLEASRRVLRARGNMSSATLPHIWSELARAEGAGASHVVSLAFGPGLTLCGAVFAPVVMAPAGHERALGEGRA